MRRAALLVAALLVVTGCTGAVTDRPSTTAAPGGASPTPTPSPSPTATTAATTPTPYPNETPTFPPGPKSAPERPERLTAETAGDYALRYEFRYSYNELWQPSAEVGLSVDSCSVESSVRHASANANAYLVVVRCVGYVNQPVSGETRTQHADLPPWTVRYYVDANSLRREEEG
jgi:hypothetical protein